MGKTTVFCVEGNFASSKSAFEWGVRHLLAADDQLHVVTVLPAIDFTPAPGGPFASSAAHVISEQWDRERKRNQLQAAETLKEAMEIVNGIGIKPQGLHTHALPESGGSAQVGSQLVKYASENKADVVVLGSRGQGALTRNLMSMVGLGSVSDHVVHNIHCPVMVVRQGCLEPLQAGQDEAAAAENAEGGPSDSDVPPAAVTSPAPGRKICVSLDRSDHSAAMLRWAVQHFFKETDEIHLVSVGTPVHYPVMDDATGAAVCTIEADGFEAAKKEAVNYAEETARLAVKTLKANSIPMKNVWYVGLQPEGGASGVGESICHYIQSNKNSMLLIGNRGMGFFQRAVTSFLGVGSVSDHCIHNAPCPVLVYKS